MQESISIEILFRIHSTPKVEKHIQRFSKGSDDDYNSYPYFYFQGCIPVKCPYSKLPDH